MIKLGNQYWFGLRKPPCQFLFGVCPCLQLFGNISYSLYSNNNTSSTIQNESASTASNFNTSPGDDDEADRISSNDSNTNERVRNSGSTEISVVGSDSNFYLPNLGSNSKKKAKKMDHIVAPALTLEMPD